MLAKIYPFLINMGKPGECASISIPDIFIKAPVMKLDKKGKLIKKQEYIPVVAVGVIRLPEDMDM